MVDASVPDVEDAPSGPSSPSPQPHPDGSPTAGADEASVEEAGDDVGVQGGRKKRAKATSPEQVAANRANAKRSTGPRTKAGKARSRLNSLKHGFYLECTPYISQGLFAEDPKEVKARVKSVVRSMGPADARQATLMTGAAWGMERRRRIERYEAVLLGAAGNVDLADRRITAVRPLTSKEIQCLFVLDALTSDKVLLRDVALVELTGLGSDLLWHDIANFLIKLIKPDHPLANPETPRPKTEAAWRGVVEGLLQEAFVYPVAAKRFVTGLFDILQVPERQQRAAELAAADSLKVMERTTP
jgi:hypothetical protein